MQIATTAFLGLLAAPSTAIVPSSDVTRVELATRAGLSQVLPIAGPDRIEPNVVASPAADSAVWQTVHVGASQYLQAIDMGSAQVGFAVGELGLVLRTTDGGLTWSTIMSLGFPYYWYGVDALDANRVILTGFDNASGDGIFRWSFDGGTTWGPIQTLAGPQPPMLRWLWHVEFIDEKYGLVEAAWSGGVHTTHFSGLSPTDWTYAQASNNWLSGSFTFLPDGRAWISGYDQIESVLGTGWTVSDGSISVFDGPIAIGKDNVGYCGGGTISPTVAGWVHRTDDGGDTWSDVVVATPFPIRALLRYDATRSWAVGGDVFSGVGGIYASSPDGWTFQSELSTTVELRDITFARKNANDVDVFVAGYGGTILRATISDPVGPPATPYCFCATAAPCGNTSATAGCVNGTGQGALIAASGTASAALDDLVLTTSQMPTNVFGLTFFGPTTGMTGALFGNGKLCVSGGTKRLAIKNAGTSGSFSYGPGLVAQTHAAYSSPWWIAAGQTLYFQTWYRDSQGPCGAAFNVSHATGITFLP